MSGVSTVLLIVLAAAALLGGLIGYALARLGERPRRESALQQQGAEHQALQQELSSRVEVLDSSLDRERDVAARNKRRWQERESAQRSRQEALETHALAQKNRIQALLEEQRSTEERQMRLERRVVALRQEFGMAARDRVIALPAPSSASRPSPSPSATTPETPRRSADGMVPVLNRRVTETQDKPASRSGSARKRKATARQGGASGHGTGRAGRAGGATIATETLPQDGDIPVLSESDLPDAMDFDDIVDER